MFSVLMAIYKGDNPSFLKESLDSLLGQTLKAGEILIVKDGPLTEKLEMLLSSYQEPSIRYLEFEKNRGLAMALRDGLSACRYELVARMDSDDVCHSDRFRQQYEAFQEDENLDVVGTSIIEFDFHVEDAKSIRELPEGGEALRRWAKRRSPANHASVMYRKSSVLRAGNYQDFLWNEDYHLWSRMMLAGCVFKNLKAPLLYVRGGKAMYMRRGGLKYLMQDLRLQYFFFKIGYVGPLDMMINFLFRLPIRLFPNPLRRLFYERFLRQS